MKNKLILSFMAISCFLFSCNEDNLFKPFGNDNNVSLGQVSNVQISNIPGGAILKYNLPKDPDLAYVKAMYTSSLGIQREVTASAYVDSLRIVGLGDTKEYLVNVVCVDNFENRSEPVTVKINPLEPIVKTVFKTIKHAIGFGGFEVTFENPSKAEIAIYALVQDSASTVLNTYDAYYTSQVAGLFPVRGLPNKENNFGVFVRDRYDNTSDTIFFSGKPFREDYLNKKQFNYIQLPGDGDFSFYYGNPLAAFDDILSHANYATTETPCPMPARYTLDLGVSVKLSRFRMYQRPGEGIVLYQHAAPYYYKVYGRANKPNNTPTTDPMEGWTLLRECISIKPSGLPGLGQVTAEDIEYAAKGEEYSFSGDCPEIRYVRFEFIESWSGMQSVGFGEVSFWGEVLK